MYFHLMAEYWYCITHARVEGEEGCPNKDRLGPYDTEADASAALEKAAKRTEEWDNDPRWNDKAVED
ncbi:MAG: hypothetical protein WKF79_06985 [Nocardioides sp.]